MIILGGGLVKHHTCNANLMVRQQEGGRCERARATHPTAALRRRSSATDLHGVQRPRPRSATGRTTRSLSTRARSLTGATRARAPMRPSRGARSEPTPSRSRFVRVSRYRVRVCGPRAGLTAAGSRHSGWSRPTDGRSTAMRPFSSHCWSRRPLPKNCKHPHKGQSVQRYVQKRFMTRSHAAAATA